MPSRKKSDNEAGLAELKRLGAPGSPLGPPGALPGRLHGRYATATIGGVTLDLFEWELSFEMDTFDATAHGEWWKVRVQGDQSWTLRARSYYRASQQPALVAAGDSAQDPSAVAVTCYKDHTATTSIWSGNGYITRCNFSAPMAMVMQDIEITSTGAPGSGV
jgi:hypothetical protein